MADQEKGIFTNRIEAGELLADKLERFKNESGVILAVPRGGIPVAYPVAVRLGLPLELILTKKISHPGYREFAIGAASLTDHFVIARQEVTDEYIREELKRIRERLKEMQMKFMADDTPTDLTAKTVIVIDDGIATGNTLLATIHLLRHKHPGRIVVAVPVASHAAVKLLSKEVDEVVALRIPHDFHGVGAYYHDFEQVSDGEVLYYLNLLRNLRKTA